MQGQGDGAFLDHDVPLEGISRRLLCTTIDERIEQLIVCNEYALGWKGSKEFRGVIRLRLALPSLSLFSVQRNCVRSSTHPMVFSLRLPNANLSGDNHENWIVKKTTLHHERESILC